MKHRYLPMTEADQEEMLKTVGAGSIDELFADIPAEVRYAGVLPISEALSEPALLRHMRQLADRNADSGRYASFLGAGIYDHHIPVVINHILSRSEFYTAYTPYQPEISQGELQAIFEFQSYICELTGMKVANASMYDGATALAEAAALASGATGRRQILVSRSVHPEAREIILTSARGLDLEVVEIGCSGGVTDPGELAALLSERTAAVLMQSPNFFGCIEDIRAAEPLVHAAGALLVLSANPLSLGLLESPGALGADIAVGDAQPLGIPTSLGGPTCGFFAVTEPLMRRLPGRIVGQTVDRDGKRGFVLTLQAREQHIRREKATSNICSNQALLALCASVYMSTMGKTGMREVALLNLRKAHYAAQRLSGPAPKGGQSPQAGTAHAAEPVAGPAMSHTPDGSGKQDFPGTTEPIAGHDADHAPASDFVPFSTPVGGTALPLAFQAPFFNEFAIRLPEGADPRAVNEKLLAAGYIGGYDLGAAYPELRGHMLLAVTERRTKDEIDDFVRELEAAL